MSPVSVVLINKYKYCLTPHRTVCDEICLWYSNITVVDVPSPVVPGSDGLAGGSVAMVTRRRKPGGVNTSHWTLTDWLVGHERLRDGWQRVSPSAGCGGRALPHHPHLVPRPGRPPLPRQTEDRAKCWDPDCRQSPHPPPAGHPQEGQLSLTSHLSVLTRSFTWDFSGAVKLAVWIMNT